MNRRSAVVLAAGTVAAIASVVLASVITLEAPAVAGNERPAATRQEPRVRTVTHTITIHKRGDGSAVTTTSGVAPVSTVTSTAPSAPSFSDDEHEADHAEGSEGSLEGSSGSEAYDD